MGFGNYLITNNYPEIIDNVKNALIHEKEYKTIDDGKIESISFVENDSMLVSLEIADVNAHFL